MPWIDVRSLVWLIVVVLASPRPAPRPQDREGERARRAIPRLYGALEAELGRPGTCPFDVESKARELGHDRERIFRFVRDEIACEPYPGAQRGPRGVLVSGAGNALDKSALLHGMLSASGIRSRIVRGKLEPARAAELADRFLREDASPRFEAPSEGDPDPRAVQETAALAEVLPERLEAAIREYRKKTEAKWDDARTSGLPHADLLLGALGDGRKAIGFDARRDELIRRVANHYWVETWDSSAQRWTALDSSFRDTSPGTEGEELKEVPNELRTWITVQLELDRSEGERRETQVLLAVRIAADELPYESLTLRVHPAEEMPDGRELLKKDGESLRKLVTDVKKFQGVLFHGERMFGSRPFDTDGRLYRVDAKGHLQEAAKMLDDVLGEDPPPTKLHALTLRLKLEAPARAAAVQTRKLFPGTDLAGPYAEIDIFVQPCPVSPHYAAYMPLRTLLRAKDAMLDALAGTVGARRRNVRFPVGLLGFAVLRQRAIARILKERKDDLRLLWESPLVVLQHRRLRFGKSGQDLAFVHIVDIWENPGPFVPARAEGAEGAWKANLALGAFDSCLEGFLLDDEGAEYAARSFERERAEGIAPALIRPEEREAKSAAFSEADRDWIRRCVPADRILVASGRKTAAFWYVIDPHTGSCVARVSGGGGQAEATETIVELKMLIWLFSSWSLFLDRTSDWNKKGDAAKNDPNLRAYLTARTVLSAAGVLLPLFGVGPAFLLKAMYLLVIQEVVLRHWRDANGW